MKTTLLFLFWAPLVFGSCKAIRPAEDAGIYELWLSRQQPVLPLNFSGWPVQRTVVYRTASFADAQSWQESLLAQGLVTELRRKGEVAHD